MLDTNNYIRGEYIERTLGTFDSSHHTYLVDVLFVENLKQTKGRREDIF